MDLQRVNNKVGKQTKKKLREFQYSFFLPLFSFFPSMAFILCHSELSTFRRNRPRRTGHSGQKGAVTTRVSGTCQKLERTLFPECPVSGGSS